MAWIRSHRRTSSQHSGNYCTCHFGSRNTDPRNTANGGNTQLIIYIHIPCSHLLTTALHSQSSNVRRATRVQMLALVKALTASRVILHPEHWYVLTLKPAGLLPLRWLDRKQMSKRVDTHAYRLAHNDDGDAQMHAQRERERQRQTHFRTYEHTISRTYSSHSDL